MGKLSIRIEESADVINTKIRRALLKDLNKTLDKISNRVVVPMRNTIQKALLSEPEVTSLRSGILRKEFGLRDGRRRVDDIIEIWTNGLTIKKTPVTFGSRGRFKGGFIITAIPRDFSDVINTEPAVVTTEEGQELEWLKWLLLLGDRIIVKNYEVVFGPFRRSRAGGAIMTETKRAGWGVPPEFAGTIDNNWVTRALDKIEPDVNKLIKNELRRAI